MTSSPSPLLAPPPKEQGQRVPVSVQILVFFGAFISFAWFNQGGGWNQNARFAEVRAIVEEGRFPIDNFLVYRKDPDTNELVRVPIKSGDFTWQKKSMHLAWVDSWWTMSPVGKPKPGVELAPMVGYCASGDVGYVPWTGHFHPNKPPGVSFLAVPAYYVIYHVEKALGFDPDHWWILTVNVWLTTALTVGLFSALGCVVFLRLAARFPGANAKSALIATILMAFGTTYFPFGTILMDHNITAALLLSAFALVSSEEPTESVWRLLLAGFCAGIAALTNNVAAVPGFMLGLFVLLKGGGNHPNWNPKHWNWKAAMLFSAGVLPTALLLLSYSFICFGKFTFNTSLQNPLFKDEGGFLGMFKWPSAYVFGVLTVLPMRGIFFLAPILIAALFTWGPRLAERTMARRAWTYIIGGFLIVIVASALAESGARGFRYGLPEDHVVIKGALWLGSGVTIWGIIQWCRCLRGNAVAASACLCLGIAAFFFLVNCSFNGYHAGFSAGPRYLVPAIPFVALPLGTILFRRPYLVAILGGISLLNHIILTATDAANPAGVGGHARVQGHPEWNYAIVGEYAWPLFVGGRAYPLLNDQVERYVSAIDVQYAVDDPNRLPALKKVREDLRLAIERGDRHPLPLASIEGPVSVNPVGVWEGLFNYEYWPPQTPQTRWASCNIGEFLFQRSHWSLVPWIVTSATFFWLAWALLRREERRF